MKKKSVGRPKGLGKAGQEKKEHLYSVAINLIEKNGYEATTLRKIAKKANVSPALLYKYFPNKAAIILNLYENLTLNFEQQCQTIQSSQWQDRAIETTLNSIKSLSKHRLALSKILGILLLDTEQGVFSEHNKISRNRIIKQFNQAITHSNNCPSGMGSVLAELMYFFHLGIILIWLLDKSSQQIITFKLLDFFQTLLKLISPTFKLKKIKNLLIDLNTLIQKAIYLSSI